MNRLLSRVTMACVMAALVFAPFAYGSVQPWAYGVIAALAYTALAAALVRTVMKRAEGRLRMPVLIPLSLGVALVCLQYVKWPSGLLAYVSPNVIALHGMNTGGAVDWLAPSLYRHATHEALICLSAYVALFLAVSLYIRAEKHISQIAIALVCSGFGVSLLAILQRLSGTDKLYWVHPPKYGGAIFGPFVSRNQFATYAGVCLFAGLGLLLARSNHADRANASRAGDMVRRGRSRRFHQNILISFAVALMGAAIVWSLSRGGILSLLLSFAAVALVMRASGLGRNRMFYVAGALVAMVVLVSYLGWGPLEARLASTVNNMSIGPSHSTRMRLAADGARMGLDFPALGVGAGAFMSAYPFYRTSPSPAITQSPHNEYIGVFAETGLPGLAILLATMVMIYATVIKGTLTRSSAYSLGFLAGGVGALVMVTSHSLVDFPMRSPAIAATVAVVAAMLYRAATMRGDAGQCASKESSARSAIGADVRERFGPANPRALSSAYLRSIVCLGAGIIWVFAMDVALDPIRAQVEEAHISQANERVAPGTPNALAFVEACQADVCAGPSLDADLCGALGDFARKAAVQTADPLKRMRLMDAALKLHAQAASAEPMNADRPYELLRDYVIFQRPSLAAQQAESACRLLPNDPWIRAYLAKQFLRSGYPSLAQRYLDSAADVAEQRHVDAVKDLIAGIREELGRVGMVGFRKGRNSATN